MGVLCTGLARSLRLQATGTLGGVQAREEAAAARLTVRSAASGAHQVVPCRRPRRILALRARPFRAHASSRVARTAPEQTDPMAVSLVGMALGWLRGTPSKARIVAATSGDAAAAQPQTNVLRWKSKRRAQSEFREDRELWYKRMAEAVSYEEWHAAAERLDEIEGHLEWKALDASPHYDSKLLRERLRQVQQMEAQENMYSIVNWLRGGLQRNFVGTGNIELFDHTHTGTKSLIERHQCEMTRLLYEVANCREDTLSIEKRLAFFTEARHALGKSALLLSGGLGQGMYHFGVVKALHEQNLLPRIISASSFGAVVAAVVGTSTVDELSLMFDSLCDQDGNICANLREAQQDRFISKVGRLLCRGLCAPKRRPPHCLCLGFLTSSCVLHWSDTRFSL